MAPPSSVLERQAAFSAGEVSPEVYGRTDNPAYKMGLKLARNFIPTKHGALKNRSGTKYVATSQTPVSGGIAPRLIPFNFSDGQTFVLEFGNLYAAVYQNGAAVLNGSTPVVVVTPWAIADVWRLKYAQSGDVVTLCHPNYAPQDLSRVSNTSWTISASLLAPPAWPFAALTNLCEPLISASCPASTPPGYVGGIPLTYSAAANYVSGAIVKYAQTVNNPDGAITEYVSVGVLDQPPAQIPDALFAGATYWAPYTYDPTISYGYQQYVWCFLNGSSGPPTLFMSLFSGNLGIIPGQTSGWATWWVAANDASHPSSNVTYAVTANLKDVNGVVAESMPAYLTPTAGVFPRFRDRPFLIGLNPTTLSDYTVIGFNIYCGSNGVYGLIDTVGPSQTYYQDVGNAPDFNTNPPAGTNPFQTNPGQTPAVYSWPGVVSYFQQRRIYARSDAKPGTFWGSAIGNFLDFDQPDFLTNSDSFEFQIASQRLQEIRGIIPQRELFIESVSGEFVASGSNGGIGGAITPTSIDIRESSNHGSSWLDPIYIDRTLISVTAKGNYVRRLSYDWRLANYIGADISSLVRHLLDGFTIVDWCYAEVPDAQIWMVRSDGNLVSITLDPEFEVVAFAQHDTNAGVLGNTQGQFRSACSVPEGTEDAVYFVVQRPTGYTIERLSSRFINGPNGILDYRQACFLDAALEYDGRNTSITAQLSWVVNSNPAQYTLTLLNIGFIGGAGRGFTANDAVVNNQVVIHPDGVPQPQVSDAPVAPLPPVRFRIVEYTSATVVICELDTPAPTDWTPFNNTTDWALATKTFTGLGHIEGQAIGALVDGNVDANYNGTQQGQQVNLVIGGSITIGQPGVDVIVGLPYDSDMQLLDIPIDPVKTNVKMVSKVSLEVANSRSAFWSGEDFEHLSPTQSRALTDAYAAPALITGTIVCPISGSYNQQGSACVRVSDPLPMTITAAVREYVVGGRG